MKSLKREVRSCLAGVLLIAVSVGVASCSSGPSQADRAVCTTAAGVIVAPLNSSYAVNLQTIAGGESSGDSGLAAASKAWAEALHRQEQPAVNRAMVQVEIACMRLGIWQVRE